MDYLANSSFENLRTDFDIFYTDEYISGINNKMIKMELQLFLEKILEIQNVYHLKLNDYIKQYISSKQILQNIISKFQNLNKKKFKLISKYESSQVSNNLNTFIFSYKIKSDNDIININKYEFNLWNNLFMVIKRKNSNIKEIFKKVIIDNYDNIKGRFSEVEKLICEKLINKYNNKYEKQNKKVRKNIRKNSQKIQIVTSPIQPTKSFSYLKTCNNCNKNYINNNNNNNIVKTLGPSIKHSNSKNIKNKKI